LNFAGNEGDFGLFKGDPGGVRALTSKYSSSSS